NLLRHELTAADDPPGFVVQPRLGVVDRPLQVVPERAPDAAVFSRVNRGEQRNVVRRLDRDGRGSGEPVVDVNEVKAADLLDTALSALADVVLTAERPIVV